MFLRFILIVHILLCIAFLLSGVPLFETVCVSLPLLMDIWIDSNLELMNKAVSKCS